MEEYAFRVRADGLPHDPRLRTPARAGAAVESVAPASMTVAASLEERRGRTGLPFGTEGEVRVPDAPAPVRCSPAHGHAVYVEPNVWTRRVF